MLFTCERTLLNDALTHAARAVSSHATVDVLKGILLECRDDTLVVTGNDLELGIVASLPAEVQEPGAAVLDARMFCEMARRTAGETVTLSVNERHLATVTSGLSSFDITALPADNYPALPDVEGLRTLELPQAALKRQLSQTLFAVSDSDSKGIHTGALFDIETDKLTVVALDGHRMALRHEPVVSDEAYQFVVPGTSLRELERMLESDDEATVTLHIGARHLLAKLPGRTVVTRLLEGEFLKYKNAIPQAAAFTAGVEVKAMLGGLERVGLLITERLKNPVRLTFDNNRLQLFCQTPLGRAQDDLPIEGGDELEIGFNHRYLLEALRRMDSERFRFEVSGALAPCLLLPEDDENSLFMVLPVRLKADG